LKNGNSKQHGWVKMSLNEDWKKKTEWKKTLLHLEGTELFVYQSEKEMKQKMAFRIFDLKYLVYPLIS
jgi:hypothetical protein